MRRGWAILLFVGGALLVTAAAFISVSWSPSEETFDAGPGPLARLNRFLALEHYLEKRFGCRVDSRFSMDYGSDEDWYDLVILPVEALPLHENNWHELTAFLYEESLVISGFGDYSPERKLPSQYETEGVLKRIGVRDLNPQDEEEVFVGESDFGHYSYSSYLKPEFAGETDEEAVYGRIPGFVTLHSLDVFTNEMIGEQDHVLLLEAILASVELGEESTVLVIHGRHVASLWGWLIGAGLPAVVLTLLIVALVVWHYGPRFGPLLPEPERGSRELREHFLASSRFLWRSGAAASLLEPTRRPLVEALRRRTGLAGEAELAALAAKLSGLDQNRVQQALFSRDITKKTLVDITTVLQELRHNL